MLTESKMTINVKYGIFALMAVLLKNKFIQIVTGKYGRASQGG